VSGLLIFYLTLERIRESHKEVLRSTTEAAHTQMNQLQDILSDSLIGGDVEVAKQKLSYSALFPQIVTLLLADADHVVMIANHKEWTAASAASISHYDKALAEKATSLQQSNQFVSAHDHLYGYYPINLGIRAGEIRPQHFGTLYVEYDFADRLHTLRQEAYSNGAKLTVVLFLFALVLSFLLHILITKPVDRLLKTVMEFAKGNLDIRATVFGTNEINQLAVAFNEMATELAHQQEYLHVQNVMLEEEIAERKMAQETLQVQTTQLEEEISERQMVQDTLEEQGQRLEEEIAERRQAEERLRIVFDAAQAGIIMVDDHGYIRFTNRYAGQLYESAPEEICGSRYLDHVHPDEREASCTLLQRLIDGNMESSSTERHYLRKSGGEFWGLLSARRHLDDNGILIAVIIVITDISELRAVQSDRNMLQQKFNQAQKLEAIGRLAGGVAHDFNNKLSIIMGYAELLMIQVKDSNDEQATRLNEILKAAEHSCEITRQLLAFSRSEAILPREVNLNRIIEDSRKSLSRLIGEDIEFDFKPASNLWPVLLDPTQVDQIIMNLAVNARDAMPDGGLFSVETTNVLIDRSCMHEIPGVQPGKYVQISVSDTGSGMDSDSLNHIFEPFFTTKESGKGTGLGLATIYGIVTQNTGFILVYSEVGLGTTFKIYFPKITVVNELLSVQDEEEKVISGSGTVLLVEDEVPLQKLAAEMLVQLGYTVLVANSPMHAIKLCNVEGCTHIDLILTDIVMPGMNGKEMYDKIIEKCPSMPVLYMSGYTADVIASKGVLEDSVHFIQKPFNLQKLGAMVRDAISDGTEVKALPDERQNFVMKKLQTEIDRLRPMADRLLHGDRTGV